MEIYSYLLTDTVLLVLLFFCLFFSIINSFKILKKEGFSIRKEIRVLAKPLIIASLGLVFYHIFRLVHVISGTTNYIDYIDLPLAMYITLILIICSLAGLFISSGMIFFIASIFDRKKFLKIALAFIFVIPVIIIFFIETIRNYIDKINRGEKWYLEIGKDVLIIIIIIFSVMIISGEHAQKKDTTRSNSTIISAMGQIRTISSIIYDNNNSYENVCDFGNVIGSVEDLEYIKEKIEININNKSLGQHSFEGTYTPYCVSDKGHYCVSVMLSSGEYYCVNSYGVMRRSYDRCGLDRDGIVIADSNQGIYGCDPIDQDSSNDKNKDTKDYQIKSAMDQARPVTAIIYMNNNRNYENVCDLGNVFAPISGLEVVRQIVEDNITSISDDQHSFEGVYTPYCVSGKEHYCASVMLSSGDYYCITSLGKNGLSYNRCGLDRNGLMLPESKKGLYGCDFIEN